MYYRTEVVEKLSQFQPLSKKILIIISRICTEPGIKVRSLFNVINPLFPEKMPWEIQSTIDGLSLGSWVEVIGDEVKAVHELASIISDIEIEDDSMSMLGIMEKLVKFTSITPHDDFLSKIPYIRMGFAVLQYYQAKDCLGFEEDADLYGSLAVNVSKAVGVTKGIGGCRQIYDLPVYKVLLYSQMHVKYGSTTYAQICLALASIHNQVFEYEGCQKYIEQARIIAIQEGITDTEVQVFIAKSDMLLNQTLFGEALFYLKLAFDLNVMLHGDGCEENIDVIIRICNICLYLRKKDVCKKWFDKMNCHLPRYSEQYIIKKMIEGELYEELEFGLSSFEEAELVCYRIFGFIQPYIHIMRSRYYDYHNLYEEGNNEYGAYMRQLRTIYGVTTNGDLAVFYSSWVMTCLANGAIQTAANLNTLAIDLCPADGPQFSFGARTSQYLAIASTYCATHEKLATAYATAVIEQVNRNVKVSNEMVNTISDIFGSKEQIPASVFGIDFIWYAYRIKIDVAIYEGRYEDAISLCNECLKFVRGTEEECFLLSYLGYVNSMLGQVEDASKAWERAADTSGANALQIAADTAWFAYRSGLTNIALDVINDVSEKPIPSACYTSYLTLADICASAGLKDLKEFFYAAARKKSRGRNHHARCLYYEALELQDYEAINRLEKSVDCPADSGLCVDEELSLRWKALAENRYAIGLRSSAKTAAINAVKFYPAERADWEDIEELL